MQRGKGRPFVKGQAPGRIKGTKNKLTKSVRETVLQVFNELQGDPKDNLYAFAKKYPREFYNIASRLIPAEVNATVEGETVIRFIRDEGDQSQA